MVRHNWDVFAFFGLLYAALDANPMSQFFSLKAFLETRLPSESLEPSIDFLAYLEPKLWLKNKKVAKISAPTNSNLA